MTAPGKGKTPAGAHLARGRELYTQHAWADACTALRAADAESTLCADDLERLAFASGLSGDDQGMLAALERAHHAFVLAGDARRAARAAFWSGYRLIPMGETARAQAWLARAQRLLDREPQDCVERGYLLLPDGNLQLFAGKLEQVAALASTACEIGERFAEPDLIAMARVLAGRTQLKQGNVKSGLAALDDAMLPAASRELSASVTGLIYCQVISACDQVYALDRSREWTAALETWCDTQPQLVTFAGACMVHRSELLQLGGDWSDAIDEARRAEQRLSAGNPRAKADAYYQRAEIHRLRGEHELAEAAYAHTSSAGREPLPGLALLRVAQGRLDAAVSAMRRIIATTRDPLQRARYLPAHVEVMLAGGELDEARAARDELSAIAATYDTPVLHAMAAHADAAVLLAGGDAHAAVEPLRAALLVWQSVGAPYIAARLHALLGRAFLALGDADGAEREWSCAREAFEALGAAPDLLALAALLAPTGPAAGTANTTLPVPAAAPTTPAPTHGLSARELEVLRLVAAGKTNRVIAGELHLSEKTVDRHVSNIFGKIDVSSRAAATAYAYENRLV